MKKIFSIIIILLFFVGFQAQNKPAFWDDIQHFKQLNIDNPPAKNAILFIGSSSFTKWTDVNEYFPEKTIINRGFGGSSLSDLNFYSEDLLNSYDPKQIIIYCGDNDFAASDEPSVNMVFKRFKIFYKKIREKYPDINVGYISIKHSPSRENLWSKIKKENAKISNFLKHQKNAAFIDITKPMEDAAGNVRKELFLEDNLHMKPEGYRIWAKEIAKYLK